MSEPALSYAFAKAHGLVLLSVGDTAKVGLLEGSAPTALIEARRVLGRPIEVERLSKGAFDRHFSEAYSGESFANAAGMDDIERQVGLRGLAEEALPIADLLDPQDDAPVIRLINGILTEAVRREASDVHIEPYESNLIVRLRVDGILNEALTLPNRLAPLLVSRVKVMARLDIAEKRLPQDGRISVTLGGRSLDVRVSTLPARGGERVVMRLLDKEQAGLPMHALGMHPTALDAFQRALAEPNGIVLVTGPTGSGKTTTLYAGLQHLNTGARNILTIEDPVEYAIDGVGQTQVNTKVGMTFAAGLRAILRQDPDIVMVGEIRDSETAQIAVQASLTGHLVLSTVHTNDALGAVTRLRDMGVEPFLLASTLRLVLAQRLVRRLCSHCRKPEPVEASVARLLNLAPDATVYRAVGCPTCGQSGYRGRIGIYEVVRVDDRLRRLISAGADEMQMADAAFVGGGDLAREAGPLLLEGVTTPEEVLRVTRQERSDGAV